MVCRVHGIVENDDRRGRLIMMKKLSVFLIVYVILLFAFFRQQAKPKPPADPSGQDTVRLLKHHVRDMTGRLY